jgi:hypothetical protein
VTAYKVEAGQLIGPGLRVEAAALVEPERQADPAEGRKIILDAIVDIANGAYREGRKSTLAMYDHRALLRETAHALRALSTIVGGFSDRRDRAADLIERLLREHEEPK